MRVGDIVSHEHLDIISMKKRVVHCVVASLHTHKPEAVLLMDEQGTTYVVFPEPKLVVKPGEKHEKLGVLLSPEAAAGLRQTFDELLRSKYGREQIAASKLAPQRILRRVNKKLVSESISEPGTYFGQLPAETHGHAEPEDIPLRLAIWGSSDWSNQLESFLTRQFTKARLDRLLERDPIGYEVFLRRRYQHLRFRDIAKILRQRNIDMPEPTLRTRERRARLFLQKDQESNHVSDETHLT